MDIVRNGQMEKSTSSAVHRFDIRSITEYHQEDTELEEHWSRWITVLGLGLKIDTGLGLGLKIDTVLGQRLILGLLIVWDVTRE